MLAAPLRTSKWLEHLAPDKGVSRHRGARVGGDCGVPSPRLLHTRTAADANGDVNGTEVVVRWPTVDNVKGKMFKFKGKTGITVPRAALQVGPVRLRFTASPDKLSATMEVLDAHGANVGPAVAWK